MPVVVVEPSELKNAVTDLAVCRDFLVPPILQHGTAIAHEQRGKRIQFIQSRGEDSARLWFGGFEWTRPGGHGGKNHLRVPGLRNLIIKRCTRTQRGCRRRDRKSTRLNSSHTVISYAVFCL